MYQPDMIPADPAYRKKVLLSLVLIVLGLAFLLYILQIYLQANIHSSSPEKVMLALKWLLITLAITPIAFAIYIIVFALKVYRQGMFPPEGTKVFRDTPILYDQDARRRANILVVLSGVLMFMSSLMVLLAFFLPRLLAGI